MSQTFSGFEVNITSISVSEFGVILVGPFTACTKPFSDKSSLNCFPLLSFR